MVNGSRYYSALESISIVSALSSALTIYPRQIRVGESIIADSLNSNFLQLGRSGGRPQRTVHPRWLPVNTDTHYFSRPRTHKWQCCASYEAKGLKPLQFLLQPLQNFCVKQYIVSKSIFLRTKIKIAEQRLELPKNSGRSHFLVHIKRLCYSVVFVIVSCRRVLVRSLTVIRETGYFKEVWHHVE